MIIFFASDCILAEFTMASSQTIEVVGGVYKVDGTIDFTGGTVSAAGVTVTGFRFDSTTTDGLVLSSTGSDGTAAWTSPGSPAAGSDILALDNDATGLQIKDTGGQIYLTVNSLNAGPPQLELNSAFALGANAVTGSSVTITGGSTTGLSAFQLDTAAAAVGKILATSDVDGNADWITNVSASGVAGIMQVSDGSGDFASPSTSMSANSAKITSLGTPTTGTDAATKQYVDDTAVDVSGGVGLLQLSDGSTNLGSDALLFWTTAGSMLTAENVTIPGNLLVQGTTTTFANADTFINDNDFVINNGETGAGVTAVTAGITIDRGTSTNYKILWDETSGGSIKTGLVGSLQKLAHREDTPTDTGLGIWDTANSKFNTTLTPTLTSLVLSTGLQLDTTTTDGLVLTSSSTDGTAVWAQTGSPAAGSDIVALDNSATGLTIKDAGATNYIIINSLDSGPKIEMLQKTEFGGNNVSGNDFTITGGDVTGLDSFQLNTTAINNYVLTSSGANGTGVWAAPGSPAAGSDILALDNDATGLEIKDIGGQVYLTVNSLNAGPKLELNSAFALGANDVSGSNVNFTGGDITGLDSFQLNTTINDGLILTSSGANGTAIWAENIGSGWTDTGTVVKLTASTDTVAIGTDSHESSEKLRIYNGAVLFDGTTGAVPVVGAGTRFMWVPAKSAFRAGIIAGTQWDNASVGVSSFAGGTNNTASGATSTTFGSGNTASATSTLAVGTGCTASQTYAVALGNTTSASGNAAFTCGTSTAAVGDHSAAFGNGCSTSALAPYGFVTGCNSKAIRHAQKAHAAGQFAVSGDAQSSNLVLWRQTTNATVTELTLDGGAPGSNRLTLEALHTYLFTVDLVARRDGAADESAAFKLEFAMDRQTTTISTALVGGYKRTIIGRDVGAWTVVVSADTTNASLKIDVTGESAKNIKWVAFIRMTEVAAQA
jgi:hypothetical protein